MTVPVEFAARLAALEFCLLVAYRLGFWLVFRRGARGASRRDMLRALGIGLRFDLRLALLLALPALALSGLPGLSPLQPVAGTAWVAAQSALWGLLTLVYLVDVAHYDYLHQRVNATVVEHLQAPRIAVATAWESFPVLRGALVLAAVTAAHVVLLRSAVLAPLAQSTGALPGWSWALVPPVLLLGLWGRLSKFPLRWSDAYFTPSPFVAALGLNPVLFLASTWSNRRTAGDREVATELYPELAATLGVERPDAARLELARPLVPRVTPRRPPNVVIVVIESFAAYKTGAFGNALDPTPCLDALARESVLFTNGFAVTAPTARAIFTLLTGIPDVNAVHSASRNPLVVRQRTLLNAFAGHDKHYFIGGSASWGNIRGLLAHNVPGIVLHEEGDYDAPRVDGWGISDRALFAASVREFGRASRPFVAVVHTSGNHRPWTIPADCGDFVRRRVDAATLRANGFDSEEEFNSFRFLDHSVGAFMDWARKEPWHEDTLYIVLGDHGAGAPDDRPWERLGLTHVHMPIIVHGPGVGPPRRVADVVSSVDVLPTALSLAGIACTNTTLGRDAFEPGPRHAFVRTVPRHGIVTDELFLSLPRRGPAQLFRHQSDDPCRDVAAELPDEARRLERLCRAWLEVSRCLLLGPAGEPERADRPVESPACTPGSLGT